MPTGRIIVFTGTSGAGRKTIARRVAQALGLRQVVSATTRAPRNPSQPDLDYQYVTQEQFEEWERAGAFVQTVRIDLHKYGILRRSLEEALETGAAVGLVLNRQGAEAIKRIYGDRVVRVFVYVDKQTMQERLESKGVRYDVIRTYIDHYPDEVTYRKHCEHVFDNVDLDRTVEQIVRALQR